VGLSFKSDQGETTPVWMGSYGIGITRLIGTIVEKYADEKGLVWPDSIAPFRVHIVRLGDTEQVVSTADALYQTLKEAGVSVLYDDRPVRPGEKFADSDLIGIPVRVIISEKTVAAGTYEIVRRATGETHQQTEEELLAEVA